MQEGMDDAGVSPTKSEQISHSIASALRCEERINSKKEPQASVQHSMLRSEEPDKKAETSRNHPKVR